ncbi:MAG: helix-turn-helix transcriptional regulator [Paludibacteraceae bacterium]|nr:helix-turn-helix transcriptional regulator [Paludibacteraceae bacterium]
MNERDRVLQVMQSEGMNAKQFCQEVGISPGTLSNITGGRNKPSLDVMQAILRRFRTVSCDWLIMGVGSMYIAGHALDAPTIFDIEVKDGKNVGEGQLKMPIQENKHESATMNQALGEPTNAATLRTVDKILIFYSDGTFEER